MNVNIAEEAAVTLFDFVMEHEGLHRKKPGSPMVFSYCDPASPMGRAIQKAGRWNDYLYRGYEPTPAQKALSGAPWTIGYGSTGKDIGADTAWSLTQVRDRYVTQSSAFMKKVQGAVKVPISATQLAMLTSLAYNTGFGDPKKPESGGFVNSTLLKLLNAGDYVSAADQFLRWNKAKGKVMPGLQKRRAAERAKFLSTLSVWPPNAQ